MYDDLLKAQGIIQNVMNMYDQITRKYRSCFKDDSKLGYLYTDWSKFYKAINSGKKIVTSKRAFSYAIESGDFDSNKRHESLDDYKNYSGIKLLKSIQYVENRLKKIQYLIKQYSMNIDDKNEGAYWGNQTVYYLKIRDDLLEMQWDHYIKQKDNYKNYERLFNEYLDNDIEPMRLGIMRNTVIYSILRIQKLFPNVLSSNDEENEFWKAQEKKYMWKKEYKSKEEISDNT